jgi:ketosteroid isomerase-like protein
MNTEMADCRESVFDRVVAQLNRKNAQAIRPWFADDAIMEFPFAPASWKSRARLAGIEAIVGTLSKIMLGFQSFNLEIGQKYLCEPDFLLAEGKSHSIQIDGRVYANTYVFVTRFREGRIVHWKEYFNPFPVVEAATRRS